MVYMECLCALEVRETPWMDGRAFMGEREQCEALLGLFKRVLGEIYNRLPQICGFMLRSDKSLCQEAVVQFYNTLNVDV